MTDAHLTPAELAGLGELGSRVTLVQVSSAFCAPCRAARSVLERVADTTEGVRHVELELGHHLELGERLAITTTPTVLVLDPDGAIIARHDGVPRLAGVRELLQRIDAD